MTLNKIKTKNIKIFCIKLRFYLSAFVVLYSTLVWSDKNSIEASSGDCIACFENEHAKVKFNLKRIELKPMVFTPGDGGKFYNVLRTEPKETDVFLDSSIKGPFKAIGRIQAKHGTNSWKGTAFFISPCHVLTSAHVIYSPSDEDILFENKQDPSTLKLDQVVKLKKQINNDLKISGSNRSIRFDIVRGSDGKFDLNRSPKVEEVIKLDPKSDYALVRVDKCLGVSESLGAINIQPKDKIEAEFKKILEQRIPLVTGGYPGDRTDNPLENDSLKINSSTKYSLYSGDQIEHFISNSAGSSGSPILAMYYRNVGGDLKPIDRDFMRNLPPDFEPSKVESVLVGLSKSENNALGRNLAKFMNDDNIMKYVKYDLEENKALITARIEEAKREAAQVGSKGSGSN